MSDKFKPSTWAQPAEDIAREYNKFEEEDTALEDVPEKPEALSTSLVRRGIIDPLTGLQTGNSKQRRNLLGNILGYTLQGKQNYELIFGHA